MFRVKKENQNLRIILVSGLKAFFFFFILLTVQIIFLSLIAEHSTDELADFRTWFDLHRDNLIVWFLSSSSLSPFFVNVNFYEFKTC